MEDPTCDEVQEKSSAVEIPVIEDAMIRESQTGAGQTDADVSHKTLAQPQNVHT